ncbi:MAG: hypothetical protein JNL58_12795 [Planctomyces sp.]|nr:hypothetical protein [Planctomyces sp.]
MSSLLNCDAVLHRQEPMVVCSVIYLLWPLRKFTFSNRSSPDRLLATTHSFAAGVQDEGRLIMDEGVRVVSSSPAYKRGSIVFTLVLQAARFRRPSNSSGPLFAWPFVITLVLTLIAAPPTYACPFCLAPPETWAEIVDKADVMLLAELVRVDLLNGDTEARSHLRILSVLREPGRRPTITQCLGGVSGVDGTPGSRAPGELRPGKMITLYEFVTGMPGDVFLLTGRSSGGAEAGRTFADEMLSGSVVSSAEITVSRTESLSSMPATGKPSWSVATFFYWEVSSPLTDDSRNYLLNLPSNSMPAPMRLPYFVQWLESDNPELAMDAWSEFARSQYEDVLTVRNLLDRQKLRTWIARPDTSPERLGLYGMLLGLCGNSEDKQFLKEQIGMPRPEKDFRYGIEGVIGGYLLLSGEEGLTFLEETRLQPKGVPYTEHFAVMQAVQFMWSYESDVIDQSRLAKSLRYLLNQPQVRELAITNLSRWKDWEVAPLLAEMYDSSVADDERSREAILQFMIAMNRASASQPVPDELLSVGQGLLARAEQSSPTLLKAAYRTFGGR